jgi:hypothetical protein
MKDALFSRTGVRYEVALDVLGALISHYAELIAKERDSSAPNEEVIAEYQKQQSDLRTLREDLDATDDIAVERIIEVYGPQARALLAE